MKILITGGTGFVGHQVVRALESQHQLCILSRHPAHAREKLGTQHHYKDTLDDISNLNDFDAVINLAGEPIANKRWSEHQKNTICQSRWELTSRLSELIALSQTPPSIFINASAIGIYGNRPEQCVDEALTLTEQKKAIQTIFHTLYAKNGKNLPSPLHQYIPVSV